MIPGREESFLKCEGEISLLYDLHRSLVCDLHCPTYQQTQRSADPQRQSAARFLRHLEPDLLREINIPGAGCEGMKLVNLLRAGVVAGT